jgi:proteasome assembly chaperone (PAC2) family protein
MAELLPLKDPWLVAAWPGMGNVAVGAAAYMVQKLSATLIHELPSRDLFDLNHVEVKQGVARPGRLPRNMFFEWRHPAGHRDLLIFIGEGQPNTGGFAFCQKIMEYAHQRGVKRVLTFAAMATQLHPTAAPRVFGATTEREMLDELKRLEVQLLREGQISGLNGVLLAAAAERGVPAISLLGELPFFAVGVPNPKASQAVLEAFCLMAGIEVDFADITQQAEAVEQALIQLMERMQEAAQEAGGDEDEEPFGEGLIKPAEPESTDEKPPKPKVSPAVERRIERLFEQALADRDKAFELKRELDRHGVFEQYEDRFLDLFKKAD